MLLDSTTLDHQTHYKVLCLPSNCAGYEIKKAYKKCILEIAENKFDSSKKALAIRVLEAYQVLSDTDQRFFYDLKIKQVPHLNNDVNYYLRNWSHLNYLMEQFNVAIVAVLNAQRKESNRINALILGIEDLRDLVRDHFYQFIKENLLPSTNNENLSYESYPAYQKIKKLSEAIKNILDNITGYKNIFVKEEELMQFRDNVKTLFNNHKKISDKISIFTGIALGYIHGSDFNSIATIPSKALTIANRSNQESRLAYATDGFFNKVHSATAFYALILGLVSMQGRHVFEGRG